MKQIILITSALKVELDIVKKILASHTSKQIGYSFLLTGVGNYNTLFTLQKFLEKNTIHAIVNIGVCGTKYKDTLELLQVSRIFNIANNKETLCPIYQKVGKLISIASSEKVITSKKDIPEDYVDMESYWVDFIASHHKIPHWILKVPFDIVWKKSKRVSVKDLGNCLERVPVLKALKSIESYLEKNKKMPQNIEKYTEHFRFTFAETEIFKKLLDRCTALELNFNTFYKEHKDEKKEDFLKKLQSYN